MIKIKKSGGTALALALVILVAQTLAAHERVYHPHKDDGGNADRAIYELTHPWPFRGSHSTTTRVGAASIAPMRDMRGELGAEFLDTGMIRTTMVHFEFDTDDISANSGGVLDAIGHVFEDWPGVEIEIAGYADETGPGVYNQDLSERRARSVRAYLTGHFPNLQARKMMAEGYGETHPIATNATREGRAQNRRVEFKVLNEAEFENAKKQKSRR